MTGRKIFLYFVALLPACIASAQNKAYTQLDAFVKTCDSLIQVANYTELDKVADKAITLTPATDYQHLNQFYYYKGNACEYSTASGDTCVALYKKALGFANKINNALLIVKAIGPTFSLYATDSLQVAERDSLMSIIVAINDTTKNDATKAAALLYLSRYNKITGNSGKSLEQALEALAIQKKIHAADKNNEAGVAEALLIISRMYSSLGKDDKQLEYLTELRGYINNDPNSLSFYYLFKGKALLVAKDIAGAELQYDSLTALSKKYNNSDFWNSLLDMDMYFAQVFVKWGDNDKALKHALNGSEIGKLWAYDFSKAQINYTNGAVYFARKDYPQAISYFKTAAPIAYSYSYNDMYMLCLKKLAASYAALNQWQDAYTTSERLTVVQDSLATINSDAIFAEAEEKYQNNEKRQQIEVQKTQLLFAKKQQLWLIGGLVLAALVALLLIIIYRNKKKTADLLDEKNKKLSQLNNELEEANRTKAKLFSIISHDLRSPISQVYQFLKLQQLNPQALNEVQKNELSNKIQTATGSLLETMEDLLLWSKTQMSEFKTNIQTTALLPIVDACQNLLQLNASAKNITYKKTISDNITVNTDPYYLQTIIRNLLQNAVKAAPENSEIVIGTEQQSTGLVFYISNKGGAFTQAQYKQLISSEDNAQSLNGLGLRLVEELSQKIGATVTFKSVDSSSTRVEILIP